MVVEEKESLVKRQILDTWERMRKRAGAAYELATAENYQRLKPLLFQVYEDHLGRHKEMVYWLEIQDFLVMLSNLNILEKNEEGIGVWTDPVIDYLNWQNPEFYILCPDCTGEGV
jgi:hypothetical protein